MGATNQNDYSDPLLANNDDIVADGAAVADAYFGVRACGILH